MKIFVINPGSTSTKIAVFDNEKPVWVASAHHAANELAEFHHVNEQYAYRKDFVLRLLAEASIPLDFDAVIARGGLLKPTPGGVYPIDERMKHDLMHARMEHACNLGALIADEIARQCHCPAYIADPEVVDELQPVARLTGIPEIKRISIFHALNSKAVSRKYAASIGKHYEDLNLIVVHLGGGISVGAHHKGRVIDVNNALNGEGPFSPERAGTIPGDQFAELCFSGKYTLKQIKKLLNGKGGLTAHLGMNDVVTIARKASEGEEPYKEVLDAMLYTVAKQVGAMYVTLRGHTDAIILTGGIAHSEYCVARLREQIDYLAPVILMPGEDEMGSLAYNALGALRGELPLQTYRPEEEKNDTPEAI
ncbi:MAG: butyrate kinase [Phocaeicola sp.]|uniref:butyrate kinase n=1 Tax=Phocaeicola sp. TaxID=2773926 RepID=UPI0023D10175|nr:butyrate kinase [Phocaeicola sp.]MDE5676564.1 butyrate kinase [Phocaeicola sp.]MDE6181430.1 butyrate kinase [Phocaeicola sp.]